MIKISNFSLIFILIFLLSLESFGIYRLLITIPLVLYYIIKLDYTKLVLYTYIIISLLITIDVALLVFSSESLLHYEYFVGAIFGNLFRYILVMLSCFMLYDIQKHNPKCFYKAVYYVLVIHVSVFFFQLILYNISGYYFDPISLFTNYEQRYTSAIYGDIGTIRATGLFIEPSTYSAYVGALLVIYISKNRELNFLILSVILSFFLSFSTAAIVMSSLIVCFYIWQMKGLTKKVVFLLFSLVFGIYSLQYQFSRFESSGVLDSGTFSARIDYINLLINSKWDNIVFGSGFFDLDPVIFNYIIKNETTAINDSSLFVYIFIRTGLVGLILYLIFLAFVFRRDFFIGGLLSAISLTKINLESCVFILLVTSVICFFKHERQK